MSRARVKFRGEDVNKEVPMEGHGQGVLGTVREGVCPLWKGPVS